MKITDISPAIALSPLDGRYHSQTAPLVEYLSEPALNRERMRVEVEWMILLANGMDGNGSSDQNTVIPQGGHAASLLGGVQPFTPEEISYLRAIPEDFGAEGIEELALIEATTHHDVKAVEYYIDRRLDMAAEVLGEQTELARLKP
ncbi:MAG: adenylosuccinate lyase, partial [Bifidobacterium crudilactis]|nr:adenylosuccinate lyase [Bifidobacterium crudilactis]